MAKQDRFRISFLGGAETVTGSMHLLEAGGYGLLVDCGLFQGRRQDADHRNRHVSNQAVGADAVLLTHAHIDHSGNLPSLVKRGFKGAIHCTAATFDLCRHMLLDSARIHVSDATWLNRKNEGEPGWVDVIPLYDEADAERALERFVPHDYDEPFEPRPGFTARFIDAGHVLGSATVVVDVQRGAHKRRVAFSGDVGRRNLPILRDPTPPAHPDYVVLESTYGDRTHAPVEEMQEQLKEVIEESIARGGKLIIPSFALERTQEVVYALNHLYKSGRVPRLPVYLDSPLAVNLTEVFRQHDECYDAETQEFDASHGDPFGFQMLEQITSVQDSKALNNLPGPAIIISASGMCEGGRVVHHLRNAIEEEKNTIVIVGYQAQHTLGRRIVERRQRVRIFGVERDLRAFVRVLNAFSAHADKNELLWWAGECGRQVRKFFLVHGDLDQSEALADHLKDKGFRAEVPKLRSSTDLD